MRIAQLILNRKQAFHGLYRSLVNNMVIGVSEGYKKVLELVGVGYRVSNQGNVIEFSLGYTHPIFMGLPEEVKVEISLKEIRNQFLHLSLLTSNLLGSYLCKNSFFPYA